MFAKVGMSEITKLSDFNQILILSFTNLDNNAYNDESSKSGNVS